MIGALVIFYLFLGGCGAGVLGATSAWSLAFHRSLDRTLSQTRAFESLMTRCYVAGFAMLCVAALCLLLDLGRPEFAYLLFTQPTTSVLSFGSYTLLASLIVGGFLVVANLFYVPFVHARARKIAEVACIVASVCLMTYTGVYVACMEAVALWNNIAIPVLFALSSASSGLSVMFIAAPFVCDWWLLDRWIAGLHRVHLAVLALELIALAAFVLAAFLSPSASESLRMLLGGEVFGGWFLVVVVGMGVLAPLSVETLMAVSGRSFKLLPVDVLCILGGLALRFCVIWSGTH